MKYIKKLLPLLVIFFLLITIKNLLVSAQDLSDNTKILNNLNDEIKSKKDENEFLKQQLTYVKSNDFIEKQAREKLNLVKNGEYTIIGLDTPDTKKEKKPQKEIPNWQKWLNLFF